MIINAGHKSLKCIHRFSKTRFDLAVQRLGLWLLWCVLQCNCQRARQSNECTWLDALVDVKLVDDSTLVGARSSFRMAFVHSANEWVVASTALESTVSHLIVHVLIFLAPMLRMMPEYVLVIVWTKKALGLSGTEFIRSGKSSDNICRAQSKHAHPHRKSKLAWAHPTFTYVCVVEFIRSLSRVGFDIDECTFGHKYLHMNTAQPYANISNDVNVYIL